MSEDLRVDNHATADTAPEPQWLAPRKKFKDQLELLLPFAGDKVGPSKGDFIDPSIMAIG